MIQTLQFLGSHPKRVLRLGQQPCSSVLWEFLFLRSFIIFFRTFGATAGYHIFRFPCYTSATCRTTLVLVGLVMQEIMIAFPKSDADEDESQTSLEFHGIGNILAEIILLNAPATSLMPSFLRRWQGGRGMYWSLVSRRLWCISGTHCFFNTAWVGYNNITVPK